MLYLLHRLAAARGDGLRPELLELLTSRRMIAADPKVIELAAHRGEVFVQAGPNPAPSSVAGAELLKLDRPAATLPSTRGLRKAGNN